LKCPFCGEQSDRVIDSRSAAGGTAVRRRRECVACGGRFTTYEYIELSDLQVIKNDGKREEYNRGKLIKGMLLACTKRPISREAVEKVAEEIESHLFKAAKAEVSSRQIGEMAMERLRELDEVAYVRFASVYRQFKDKSEFINELKDLSDT